MKRETITTKSGKNIIKITPENDLYLTNGIIWTKNFVFLGKYEDINNWWETDEEPQEE